MSADSTIGGELNSSAWTNPIGGPTSSVLPKPPNSGRKICPKPPSRGKPSASASGISFTLVGAATLPPCGLPSRRADPTWGFSQNAAVPPPLKWQALQFLWPRSVTLIVQYRNGRHCSERRTSDLLSEPLLHDGCLWRSSFLREERNERYDFGLLQIEIRHIVRRSAVWAVKNGARAFEGRRPPALGDSGNSLISQTRCRF